jgi:hypothetical protein
MEALVSEMLGGALVPRVVLGNFIFVWSCKESKSPGCVCRDAVWMMMDAMDGHGWFICICEQDEEARVVGVIWERPVWYSRHAPLPPTNMYSIYLNLKSINANNSST